MNALELSQAEISEWSALTQAICKLQDAHFAVFNAMEATRSKRLRARLNKALGKIYRAGRYLRPGMSDRVNYSPELLRERVHRGFHPPGYDPATCAACASPALDAGGAQ